MKIPAALLALPLLFVSTVMHAQTPTTDKLNDAQIADVVVTANKIDIDAGNFAKGRASSKAVKEFAEQMVAVHTGANQSATALTKKLDVKPEDNATSKALKAEAEKNMGTLKALKGKAFDSAYIAQEVDFHKQVLDTIDKALLPNARNEQLKAEIEKTRPIIAAHYEHAKELQGKIGK